jgi:hypothetical protein
LHDRDLVEGFGEVWLPNALAVSEVPGGQPLPGLAVGVSKPGPFGRSEIGLASTPSFQDRHRHQRVLSGKRSDAIPKKTPEIEESPGIFWGAGSNGRLPTPPGLAAHTALTRPCADAP